MCRGIYSFSQITLSFAVLDSGSVFLAKRIVANWLTRWLRAVSSLSHQQWKNRESFLSFRYTISYISPRYSNSFECFQFTSRLIVCFENRSSTNWSAGISFMSLRLTSLRICLRSNSKYVRNPRKGMYKTAISNMTDIVRVTG